MYFNFWSIVLGGLVAYLDIFVPHGTVLQISCRAVWYPLVYAVPGTVIKVSNVPTDEPDVFVVGIVIVTEAVVGSFVEPRLYNSIFKNFYKTWKRNNIALFLGMNTRKKHTLVFYSKLNYLLSASDAMAQNLKVTTVYIIIGQWSQWQEGISNSFSGFLLISLKRLVRIRVFHLALHDESRFSFITIYSKIVR